MSSFKYDKFSENLGKGNIDLINDDVRICLVDTSIYTVNQSTDEFLSDIPEAAIVQSMTTTLMNRELVGPVFDAQDVVFDSVSGGTVGAIVFYIHTGTAATSYLIAYVDNGLNMPFTPGGVEVEVRWSNGANKIFAL